jgi:phenylalanyl-tRNA synthetase beta subunit
MLDLNRPLHAYDADKIDKGIIVRNSKKGERFTALDNKDYTLEENMCVISDNTRSFRFSWYYWGYKIWNQVRYKKCFN